MLLIEAYDNGLQDTKLGYISILYVTEEEAWSNCNLRLNEPTKHGANK